MVTRNRKNRNDPSLSEEVERAKKTLKIKGWSYRRAASHLGYSYTHFVYVLTGRRESKTLLDLIEKLPRLEVAA